MSPGHQVSHSALTTHSLDLYVLAREANKFNSNNLH
jgi:hypothetical protein